MQGGFALADSAHVRASVPPKASRLENSLGGSFGFYSMKSAPLAEWSAIRLW